MSDESTLDEFVEREGDKSINETTSKPDLMTSLDQTSVGNIPSDWSSVRLEELTRNTLYGANESAEEYDPTKPRYIRIKDIDERGRLKEKEKASLSREKAEGYFLQKGDLLFARSGSPGRTYLHRHNHDEYCYGGYSIKHELVDEGLNHEYVSQYTKSQRYWDWIKRIARTGAQANINSGEYASLLLPIPPLPEQRKIATILYTIDQAIENTEKIIEQSKYVRRGLKQDLFTGRKYESERRVVNLEPVDTEIPAEWDVVSLGDITENITEMPHHMPDKIDDGVPFITTGDISEDDDIDLSSVERISEEDYERLSNKFDAERGDILYTRYGTIGIANEVTFDPKFIASYSVALLKPKQNINSTFLTHQLNSWLVKKQAASRTTQSANKNFDLERIPKLNIVLPNVEEQDRIVRILSNINENIKDGDRYKERLQRLKQGLMQDLLSGTVRTTDTNIQVPDEVAQHG